MNSMRSLPQHRYDEMWVADRVYHSRFTDGNRNGLMKCAATILTSGWCVAIGTVPGVAIDTADDAATYDEVMAVDHSTGDGGRDGRERQRKAEDGREWQRMAEMAVRTAVASMLCKNTAR